MKAEQNSDNLSHTNPSIANLSSSNANLSYIRANLNKSNGNILSPIPVIIIEMSKKIIVMSIVLMHLNKANISSLHRFI